MAKDQSLGYRARQGWRRWFELLAGLTAPPIVGLVIIALVMSGAADVDIMKSGAATSTALVVGALLMIVPPILYGRTRYADHQDMVEDRLNRIADEVSALQHSSDDGAPELTVGATEGVGAPPP